MRMLIGHLLCFALAASGCLALLHAVPCKDLARQANIGADLGTVLDHCERLGREARRQEDLDARRVVLLTRIEAKQAIAHDLVEKRLTLLEAAARLRALLDAAPETWEWVRRIEAGNSDPEKLCRHIIEWVRTGPAREQQKANQMVALLKAELEEHLQHETLVLAPR